MYDIPCVILCGGRSSRMGKDKALLPFGKYDTLIEYQYKKFSKFFKKVYISSKIDKFNFEAEIIYDINQDIFSPMIALKSIMNTLDITDIFIITVDVPLVKIETIDKLIVNSLNYDITIARDKDKIHNLCGIFNISIKSTINNLLKKDIHKVNYLIKMVKSTQQILFSNEKQFININTNNDYNIALSI